MLDVLQQHLAVYEIAPHGLLFTLSGLPISRQAFGHQWRTGSISGHLGWDVRARPAALRRLAPDPAGRVREDRAGAAGYTSAAETLDAYSHLWPDSDDRTRDAVDAVLGARAGSLRTVEG